MLDFRSDKIRQEYNRAGVALRLVVERCVLEFQGVTLVFRVKAPATFENGLHARGMACDVILERARIETLEQVAREANKRFPTDPLQRQVATVITVPTNLPNGKRIDVPHIHVQIPFDWISRPRAFLKKYGYTSTE